MNVIREPDEKANILLIDDQPAKLLSYEVVLAELGENLLTASTPRRAFEHLMSHDVAVILMDVQMPEMDGFELAAMIREHPRFKSTAIIFVSAIHLTDPDRLRGYAAGAVDYVSVPVVPEVLRAKVGVFVDLHRKSRQLARMNEELEQRVAERTLELEKSNRRLLDSERRRSLALSAAAMGSWEWESEDDRFIWDEGQCRILQVTNETSWPGERFRAMLHPEDRERVSKAFARASETGEMMHLEARIRRPSGEVRWCAIAGAVSQTEAERRPRMSGVTYDVTERKLAEQSLARANEELEARIQQRTRERELALAQLFEAQKMDTIGKLTGGVAHDFNNLLMAVLGSLELLSKRVLDERGQRLLDNARKGAERGVALTRRLLAFARRQELLTEPVAVAQLIAGMSELMQRAVGPGIEIRNEVSGLQLPPVMADPNQLELAILNLVVNSRDSMSDGGVISISASCDRTAAAPLVRLCIRDNGSGMDEETRLHAAEPFFTTKGPGKGTGLGLSMVHGMLAQLGGSMEIESEVGAGTQVCLCLPIAHAEPREKSGRAEFVPQRSLPGIRVLVIDDDSLVRTGAVAMLEDMGHEVVEADSAMAGIAILESGREIDVVLTDHAMPGMTGSELLRSVAKRFPKVGRILATGYAELAASEEDSPAVRLSKPFGQRDLLEAMSRALDAEAVLEHRRVPQG